MENEIELASNPAQYDDIFMLPFVFLPSYVLTKLRTFLLIRSLVFISFVKQFVLSDFVKIFHNSFRRFIHQNFGGNTKANRNNLNFDILFRRTFDALSICLFETELDQYLSFTRIWKTHPYFKRKS